MNKRGMELRFWVIALIMFSAIFAFLVLAFHDTASCDNGYCNQNVTNPAIEARYNQLNQQEALVADLSNTTTGTGGLQLLNILGTVFTATIGVMNIVFASLTFIPSVFGNFASDFGIPKVVTDLFFVAIGLIATVLLIFAILNSIRR